MRAIFAERQFDSRDRAGRTVIVPRTRLTTGGPEISLISITSLPPVQRIEEGPTVRLSAV